MSCRGLGDDEIRRRPSSQIQPLLRAQPVCRIGVVRARCAERLPRWKSNRVADVFDALGSSSRVPIIPSQLSFRVLWVRSGLLFISVDDPAAPRHDASINRITAHR